MNLLLLKIVCWCCWPETAFCCSNDVIESMFRFESIRFDLFIEQRFWFLSSDESKTRCLAGCGVIKWSERAHERKCALKRGICMWAFGFFKCNVTNHSVKCDLMAIACCAIAKKSVSIMRQIVLIPFIKIAMTAH